MFILHWTRPGDLFLFAKYSAYARSSRSSGVTVVVRLIRVTKRSTALCWSPGNNRASRRTIGKHGAEELICITFANRKLI